jgi:predicted nucleic acid-binding protein
VITEPILVDTGPLVAILRDDDQHHERCKAQAREFHGPVFSCWPVVTEAAWLLRSMPEGLERLLNMLVVGDLACLDLDQDAPAWITEYHRPYEDLKPQLADLCLVYLAQRDGIRNIFTLDRRDFLVYRDAEGLPFLLLPESL